MNLLVIIYRLTYIDTEREVATNDSREKTP